MTYHDVKGIVEAYTGLEKDALHIHGALLLYILAMFAFRQTRRSRIPWMFVLGVELANEALDLRRGYLSSEEIPWNEAAKDLWNTMLWPTVLLFIGRYTNLFQHRSREKAA